MKADISDAPERVIQRRQKHSVFYTAICLVIGSITTVAALQLVNRVPSLHSAYKQTASATGRDKEVTRASETLPRQGVDSSWIRESSEARLPDNSARQTVFNDQNFIPEGAENVVAFRVSSALIQEKEPPKKVKLTIVRQPLSMKDRVCWPYRRGSIESRNCHAAVGLNHRD